MTLKEGGIVTFEMKKEFSANDAALYRRSDFFKERDDRWVNHRVESGGSGTVDSTLLLGNTVAYIYYDIPVCGDNK
jgi:hypothetical protein